MTSRTVTPRSAQGWQLLHGRRPRSFVREGADVHFINDLTFEAATLPVLISPGKLMRSR